MKDQQPAKANQIWERYTRARCNYRSLHHSVQVAVPDSEDFKFPENANGPSLSAEDLAVELADDIELSIEV